ncbi:hypothetical protein DFH06DRAFT_1223552 [Mycena polygramma]|nr:hypothetical protein DFH06DRAFT_1223552 [Mycena polygramma]
MFLTRRLAHVYFVNSTLTCGCDAVEISAGSGVYVLRMCGQVLIRSVSFNYTSVIKHGFVVHDGLSAPSMHRPWNKFQKPVWKMSSRLRTATGC